MFEPAESCARAMSGHLTVRISKKNGKDKPRIVRQMGKCDKLVKDYLEVYETFKDY